jgi:glutaredoxin
MQTKSNPTKALVWSGQNCPWCERAKALLDSKGIPYVVKQIGVDGVTKEMFFEANPGARTVPQVWLDGQLVGGFDQLKAVLT